MKKRKLLMLLVSICLVLSLAAVPFMTACEEEVTPGEQEEEEEEEEEEVFELTFADLHPPEDPFNSVIFAAWANWLEEESGGRIKMTLLPAGQAAGMADHLDAARTGIVDIACHVVTFTPGRFPLSEVILLPAIFTFPDSRATTLTLMALYDKYPEIQAEFTDVKFLLFHATSATQIATTDKPVHTMEDLEGQILISSGTYNSSALSLLGATPEAVDPMESYDSLAKGIVDGTTVNWQAIKMFKSDEVTNYATEVNLCGDYCVHVMNLDTWNSLPPDLQELFVGENAWNLAELYGYRFDIDCQAAKEAISDLYTSRGYPEIYVLPESERDRWIDTVLPVREEWISSVVDLVGEATARAILEDAIAFAEQYRYETTPSEELQAWIDEWLGS